MTWKGSYNENGNKGYLSPEFVGVVCDPSCLWEDQSVFLTCPISVLIHRNERRQPFSIIQQHPHLV
jgi:hypothetical protein